MLVLSHKKLKVYEIAVRLVKDVYMLTRQYPGDERFVLIPQIRRAAISVCSNIAEGAARISKNEKKRFYEIARSSLVELDTHFELSKALMYLNAEDLTGVSPSIESIFKMLSKIIDNLEPHPPTSP